MTEQRRLIYEIIQNAEQHLTAEQIFFAAKEQMPSIAVGTIYRNLGLMERCGEIRRIAMPNAPDFYDKSTTAHEHLYCRCCGSLTDVTVDNLKSFFQENTNLEIEAYDLILYGHCGNCAK